MKKDLEKDFFKFILNHTNIKKALNHKEFKSALRSGFSGGEKKAMTEEDMERELYFKELAKTHNLKDIFYWFLKNNHLSDK